jgi:hypothetical protein
MKAIFSEISRSVFLVFFALISLTGAWGQEIMKNESFLRENNSIIDRRITLFLKVLKNSKPNPILENKIKLKIVNEIDDATNWLEIDIVPAIGEDGHARGTLAVSEWKGRLNGLLHEMRSTMEGFHKDLPNNSSITERLEVLRHEIKLFDQILLMSPQ